MFTERRNKRCKLSLDINREQLSYVSETQSQSEDDKFYDHLGSGDENVLPIIVSEKDAPEPSTDEQEDTSDTKHENRTKNVFKYTSVQSEKDKIIKSCIKICKSGSQTMSSRANSSKQSPEHLATSLQFGTKKSTFNHCNFGDESHDFKMGSKRDRETSAPSVGSKHDTEGETTDDDDIFYCRRPRNSSLDCEKEKRINTEIACLDSQNKSARSANDKISGLSVTSKHCRDDSRVFRDGSAHRATDTPHLIIGFEHDRTENNAVGGGENAGKKSMLTRRKRETRSSNKSVRSKHDENDHVSNDSKSPKQGNVSTRSKRRATASNNSVGCKHDENECDLSGDGENPKNGNILHRWKSKSDISYHLIASDHGKNKSNVTDDDKHLNNENVLTRLKKRTKALNSSVRSKHNETEDVSGDGENPNKENVSSRKNRTKMCISSDRSEYDQNEGHITDDGKSPKKENMLKRRERGTETYHLIASEYDRTDNTVFVTDVISKNESVFTTAKMTGMPKHDEDDIFYTTPQRSLLYKKEKGKTDNSCNENCTLLKSSGSKKYKNVMNNSSQSMLTRNNVSTESLKHSIKSMVSKNENIQDSGNSSDEKSTGIDLLTDSHKHQFSGDVMEKIHSSSDKSDDNNHKMKSGRTEVIKVSSIGSEHSENEEEIADDDDDDDIFYKTPRKSLFYEKERGRMSNICGNENVTCLKSNETNKNSSSQNLSSRNNMSRESHKCSVNSVVFRNENIADKDSSSDRSSAGIEDLLTDSHRQQFSGDIMENIHSSDTADYIHKINMKSKLMKSSKTETQEDNSSSSEHLENEEKVMEHDDDDDDDDIFYYRTHKQSIPCRKGKK
jgi:hypothetical protein